MPITPVDHDPFEGAAPAPTISTQSTPLPGTVPGNLNANTDLPTSMVPLDDEAQWAQNLLRMKAIRGDRGGVQGANDLLKTNQSYQAREGQARAAGADAERRAEARRTGANILRSYAQLLHSFDETPKDKLEGAIGPYNTQKIGPAPSLLNPANWIGAAIRPSNIDDMTPPQAAAAHPYNPYTRLWGNKDAWDTQNLFGHDVHGITNAFMSGGSKSLNMSDKRQEAFDATMRDFMKASSRDNAKEILDHAKGIIANDFGLSPAEADATIKAHINEITRNRREGSSISEQQVVRVNSPDEAAKLPKGTPFIGHDGIPRVRQ